MTDTPLNGNLKYILIAVAIGGGLLGAGGGYAGSMALDTQAAVLTERVTRLERDTDGLRETVHKLDGTSFVIDPRKWISGAGQ